MSRAGQGAELGLTIAIQASVSCVVGFLQQSGHLRPESHRDLGTLNTLT